MDWIGVCDKIKQGAHGKIIKLSNDTRSCQPEEIYKIFTIDSCVPRLRRVLIKYGCSCRLFWSSLVLVAVLISRQSRRYLHLALNTLPQY